MNIRTLINSRKFHIFTFLLTSCVVFIWFRDTNYLIGRADYISPFNLKDFFYTQLFPYDIYSYGGSPSSFRLAQIPFFLYIYSLELIRISPALSTIFMIYFIIFISQVSFYTFLNYLGSKYRPEETRPNTSWVSWYVSIFYGLSPVFLTFISPGHFLLLVNYSLMPLYLYFLLKLFEEESTKKILEILFYVYLISILSSVSFANVGILYVTFIVLGILFLSYLVCFPKSYFNRFFKFLIFISVILLSNFWWLLPFTGDAFHLAGNSGNARLSSEHNLSISSGSSDIVSSILGNASGGYGDVDFNFLSLDSPEIFISVAYFIILMLVVIYLTTSRLRIRYLGLFLVLLLFSLFISLGLNDPFGDIFLWFYRNVPGFIVFRRPGSKFYWFYIFNLLALYYVSLSYFYSRVKIDKIKYFLLPISIPFVSIIGAFLLSRPVLNSFPIPENYLNAKEYLAERKVSTVLILPPPTYGRQTEYSENFDNYMGSEFIHYIWGTSFVTPNSREAFTESNNIISLASNINENLLNDLPICELTRQAGISHILLRDDLIGKYDKDIKNYLNLIDSNSAVFDKREFNSNQDSIYIYRLRSECAGDIINIRTEGGNTIEYEYKTINPNVILLKIPFSEESLVVDFTRSYSSSWRLFKVDATIFGEYSGYQIDIYPLNKKFLPLRIIKSAVKSLENLLPPNPSLSFNEWVVDGAVEDSYYVVFNTSILLMYLGVIISLLTFIVILVILLL